VQQSDLAFSSAYLLGRPQGVTICGVNFNVLTIAARSEHKFNTKNVGFRLCSVATGGRVEVKLGVVGFGIGVGGMWRVKSGEKCVVRNKGKEVVVLHVTSME
jgi:hypothetical protein